MYFDNAPCQVCGSEVELRRRDSATPRDEHEPDSTVDDRICTNADCPTNTQSGSDAPTP